MTTTGNIRAYSADLGNDGGDPTCTVDQDGNLVAYTLATGGISPLFSATGSTVRLGVDASTTIAESGGAGATQMANIAAATDLASALTLLNGIRTYMKARGSMA